MEITKTVSKQVFRAAAWGYAGSIAKLLLQFGVQIYLARAIGPAEFGLFAVGATVLSLAVCISDFSSPSIIQEKEIDAARIRFAFTVQVAIGFLVTSLIFISSSTLAKAFGVPDSAMVLRLLAPVCFISAVGGVSQALLRRKLDYRTLQLGQLIGYAAGYLGFAVPYVVYVRPSALALVGAWAVQSLITSLIYFANARHDLRLTFHCERAGSFLNFSGNALAANLGNWVATNGDRILIAQHQNVHQLGIYAAAWNLLAAPLNQIYTTFQSVAFSASSRLEHHAVKDWLKHALSIISIVFGVAYSLIFSSSEYIVSILYGSAWAEMSAVLRVLSIAMYFQAMGGCVTPFLWARGKASIEARIQIIFVPVLLGGIYISSTRSILAVACWVAAAYAARSLILLIWSSIFFSMWRYVWGLIVKSMIIAAGLAFTLSLLQPSGVVDVGQSAHLLLLNAALALLIFVLILLRPRIISHEFHLVVQNATNRIRSAMANMSAGSEVKKR